MPVAIESSILAMFSSPSLLLSFIGGLCFTCMVSFIDAFTWRVLQAYFSKQRKKIKNKTFYILQGRSKCESCHNTIPSIFLIPIIGLLLAKNKCTVCKSPVSKRFFIEETMAFTYGAILIWIEPNLILFSYSLLYLCILFFIAKLDWETMLVPTLPILIFATATISEFLFHFKILSTFSLTQAILLLTTSFLWYTMFHITRILSNYNLGLADVLLIIPLCLGLYFPYGFFIPTLASILAIIYYVLNKKTIKNDRGLKTKLPFATFLIIAFAIFRLLQYFFPIKTNVNLF